MNTCGKLRMPLRSMKPLAVSSSSTLTTSWGICRVRSSRTARRDQGQVGSTATSTRVGLLGATTAAAAAGLALSLQPTNTSAPLSTKVPGSRCPPHTWHAPSERLRCRCTPVGLSVPLRVMISRSPSITVGSGGPGH